MRNNLRGLSAAFLTLLLGNSMAQNTFDGPHIGNPELRYATREADWYCDINRVIGCTKLGHVCYLSFIFGDEECDPLVAQSTRCPTTIDADECFDHDVGHITHF